MPWPPENTIENTSGCQESPDGQHEWVADSGEYEPTDYSSAYAAEYHSYCQYCGAPKYPDSVSP